MAFEVTITPDRGVTVSLTGAERFCLWRRQIEFAAAQIRAVDVMPRGGMEVAIDHRAFGIGTHVGEKRPGRRRVGSMLGRNARGPVFWAVSAGGPEVELLVLSLADHRFVRAVLEVPDPHGVASRLSPPR